MKALKRVALVMLLFLIPGSSFGGDCPKPESLAAVATDEAKMVALEQEYPECADINVALGNYYYDRSIWKAAYEQYSKALKSSKDNAGLESRVSELEEKMGMSIASEGDLGTLRGISGLKKLPPLVINVQFDTNSANIKAESKRLLDQFASMLQSDLKGRKFIIQGHTDSLGGYESNLRLSQSRAQSVRDYLVKSRHVDPNRFDVRGFSYEKPIDTNLTSQGRQHNRRVQFESTQ
jgi:outer membrane protein OmpA-like peptidoglycan-associated protein